MRHARTPRPRKVPPFSSLPAHSPLPLRPAIRIPLPHSAFRIPHRVESPHSLLLPDPAFLFCILHRVELPDPGFLFRIPHRVESPRSPLPYSCRSAAIGSMRDARSAGKYPAPNATAVSTITDAAITHGSYPFSSYSSDFAAIPSASAPARPTTPPISVISPTCFITILCTLPPFAPSAMRTPISRVRWATEYESTP